MKIKILTKDVELDDVVESYIILKIDSLEKFLKKDEENFCDFRIGKNSGSHKNGKIYFAEASIKTSSKNYGARSEAETMMESIDELKSELTKKISRYKDKKISLRKKGGRLIKDFLRKLK